MRCLFMLGLGLLYLGGCSPKGEGDPLPVGHVAPLSGEDRAVGEHQRRGIRLLLEGANEERINNRRVVVLHADSRGDPAQARSEAVRLIAVNRVLAVLGGGPRAPEKLAAAVQASPATLLTPVALVGPAALGGVFSLDVAPDFRGRVLASFADKELNADRALVLVDEGRPACVAVASAFERRWRAGERNTVRTRATAKPDGAKIAGLIGNAQVIVFAAGAAAFGPFRAALAAGGKEGPRVLFAGEPPEWARLREDGEAARGVHAATAYAPMHFTGDGKQFVERYRKRYDEGPDLYAFQGYELASVLVEALRGTNGIGEAKLREELGKEREFQGLTGTFRFKEGHAARPLYVVRGGAEDQAKEYKPE